GFTRIGLFSITYILTGSLDLFRGSLGRNAQGFPVVKFEGVTGTNVNLGVGITDQATNVFIIKGTKSPSIVPTNPNWSPK
ncbi:hypothetical protein QOU23_30135, partial [Pseudomonas aeruginosa]